MGRWWGGGDYSPPGGRLTPPAIWQAHRPGPKRVIAPGGAAGIFRGRLVIITGTGAGSGLFIYAGTPALGNPPVLSAVAPGTTTDPYGNPVLAVLELQGAAGVLSITTPALVQFPSLAAFENTIAGVAAGVGGTIPAQFISLGIRSASTTTAGARDLVELSLNSANADNSSSANMDFIYFGSNGTPHEYAFVDITGLNILAGSIVGVDPGSSPATPATWHTIALQNGYTAGTNNGFVDVPQVRASAENKRLEFKGSLTVPGAPASIVWGLLPAGFPNANFGGPFGLGLVANYAGGVVDHIQVQNNSNLSLNNGIAHAGSTFNLCCQVPTQ